MLEAEQRDEKRDHVDHLDTDGGPIGAQTSTEDQGRHQKRGCSQGPSGEYS